MPGVITIAPWALVLISKSQELANFYQEFSLPIQVAMFALVVVTGALIEGFGTYVERRWDINCNLELKEETTLEKDWYDYLSRVFGSAEPVGYRYISRKVTTLYFELGMMFSTPFGLIGMTVVLYEHQTSCVPIAILVLGALISPFIFCKLAHDSYMVLCKTRARINFRLNSKPA